MTFAVLRAIPDESILPVTLPEIPPSEVLPKSFDELFSLKDQLQRHQVVIPRSSYESQAYAEYNSYFGTRYEELFAGKNLFEFVIDNLLKEDPIFITLAQFPYSVPPDTCHHLLWHKPEVSVQEQATYLAEKFLNEGVKERDFVIVRNPVFARSVPTFPHKHLFIRRKPEYSYFGANPYID